MKRFTSFLVVISMLLAMLPMVASATDDVPQLVDGYYEIYNADQLYWFAARVNGGDNAINGKLMADIVVNENVLTADGELNGDGSNFRVWTLIGYYNSYADYAEYNGTFDGNGKVVSGLYINDTSESCIGLFGYVGSGGVVKNVGVVACYLSGGSSVSSVVGSNLGTVSDCYNTGVVNSSSGAGGVVASNSGTVQNCYNIGSVSGKGSVGGVVGYNVGTISNSFNTGALNSGASAGGVVYQNYGGTVSNSYNEGSVNGEADVGGVVGDNIDGIVRYCYNVGNISGTSSVGGVAGFNFSRYSLGVINNCYNTGTVSGYEKIGGILACNWGSLKNSYNTGKVTGYQDIAGVVAENDSREVSNCYYRSDCVSYGNYGGIPKSASQFASGEVAYLLQGNQAEEIWGQKLWEDATPQLFAEKVHWVPCCEGLTNFYSNENAPISGHAWMEANCVDPQICGACGAERGEPLGHTFSGGFCVICDGYEPAVLNNDVYEIYHSGHLYWFAEQVNGGNIAINGRLMADIVVNENVLDSQGELNGDPSDFRLWDPIGSVSYPEECPYCGVFEGNGKTVSGLYFTSSGMHYRDSSKGYVGLFGGLGTGGVVRNLGVIDSYFYAEDCVGAVVGSSRGTVTNCFSMSTIDGGWYVGGVVGDNYNGIVSNCFNAGMVSSHGNADSYNLIGGVVGEEVYGVVSNCYHLVGCVSYENGKSVAMTSEQFASGEVANLLQGNQPEKVWGQTIGQDAYPVLCTEGVVWDDEECRNCTHSWPDDTCPESGICTTCGKPVGAVVEHRYGNGFCIYCDAHEPAVLNGDVYEIYNAGQLYWFAELINSGNASINGKLMADILVNSYVVKIDDTLNGDGSNFRVWTPIGNNRVQYTGTFDGKDKRISGLYFNDPSQSYVGLFGYVSTGGVVKKVSVVDTYMVAYEYAGAVVGYSEYGTVSKCSFDGVISGTYADGSGEVVGGAAIGGIVGYNKYGTVNNCYSLGFVRGAECVGGVVGFNDYGTVSNSYSAGIVRVYTQYGEVVGYNQRGTVTNCYYLPNGTTVRNPNGIAKTWEQFCSGEVAYLLQGNQPEQIWGQDMGPLPEFSSDRVYYSNGGYTSVPTGATVRGTITSFLVDGDVTIELLQGGELVFIRFVSGKTVDYAIKGVAAGTYTLRISKENHATREYEVVVGEEDVTLDCKICPVGDVTGDGVVNIKDFQRLLKHVNRTAPLEGYALTCGNVTNDGACNIKDFQRLLKHVNRTQPLF